MLYTTRWGLRLWLPVFVNRTAVSINGQESFLFIASGFEAVGIAASAVAIGLSVFALSKASMFNKNILLLSAVQLVDFLFYIISRIIFLHFTLFCSRVENSEMEDLLISTALYLKTYSICSSTMVLSCLVVERFLATIYRTTYEKSKSLRIGCTIVLLKALLSLAFSCYSLFARFRLYRLWIVMVVLNAAMFGVRRLPFIAICLWCIIIQRLFHYSWESDVFSHK
ncbi:hypothetical protein Y032_0664g1318 [Ancylostoma ceylanicum]|uniref:Uncharacterized protein n=1 Tax=Ancylostoma ceylanicum TaxID=53326 RepID=A0A016WI24_9BILA|nr:hypothetical protein Y032_0664g1318 [Ancylostoma ceylanicum]